MRAKLWPCLVLLPLIAGLAHGQESVRKLSGPGEHSKFLTPGQFDRWLFEGDKGETIIAHVATKEFDPILELARGDEKDDKVLLEVDDPGSESRFALRLPAKGKYSIRIHAFKFQGGGTSPNGEKLTVWGRRILIPAARPGTRNGFEITMLATSLSDDIKSVDDVGVKGELGPILYSFEPSQNF